MESRKVVIMESKSPFDLWKSQLVHDGRTALRSLLNGTASLGSLTAAEPDDAVKTILAQEARDSAVVRGFDRGCLELLEEFRSTLLQKGGSSYRIELAKLATLMAIIRRFMPEQTVAELNCNQDIWSNFFAHFVIDSGLDLKRDYLKILAQIQADGKARFPK